MTSLVRAPSLSIFFQSALLLWSCHSFPASGSAVSLTDERILQGYEINLQIRPTDMNYYLATLIDESNFYAPTFYEDYLITLDQKPVMQFTLNNDGKLDDVFFYIRHPDDLNWALRRFEKNVYKIESVSVELLPALKRYQLTQPTYSSVNLHQEVATIIRETTHTTLDRVVGSSSRAETIDRVLFRYLCSNGIHSLQEIRVHGELIARLVNKFYMLSTTYFYRDWAYIKAILPLLAPLGERAIMEKRPFKAKVFACSTGEEVFTYAIELLEAGIEDFRILASDINHSSLDFASKMQYPHQAVERLPFHTQERLKKYFQHNPVLNTWSPRHPEFFEKRIRFIHQDILKSLPADLSAEFAPPYDLMSILNVLLYLEDSMVQKRKDYWRDLVIPGGLFLLRDAKYSLARDKLGSAWSFQSFLSINEWVNIRLPHNASSHDSVTFYENRYARPTEMSLRLLQRAYSLTGQNPKLLTLSRNYLQNDPHSFFALTPVIAQFIDQVRHPVLEDHLMRLCFSHIDQIETLNYLITVSGRGGDRRFLEKLLEQYLSFLSRHKSEPEAMADHFSFRSPRSRRWQFLQPLMQLHTNHLLLKSYMDTGQIDKIQMIGMESLELARQLKQEFPEHAAPNKFLNRIVKEILSINLEEGLHFQAMQFIEQSLPLLEGRGTTIDFYNEDALGFCYLTKARLLLERKEQEPSLDAVSRAIRHYQSALPYLPNLPPVHTYSFLGQIGQCYLVRGSLFLERNAITQVLSDYAEALRYFEAALEINPLYGKDIFVNRQKLHQAVLNNPQLLPVLQEKPHPLVLY